MSDKTAKSLAQFEIVTSSAITVNGVTYYKALDVLALIDLITAQPK